MTSVSVRFFASLRDTLDCGALDLTIEAPAGLEQLLDAIDAALPDARTDCLRAENVRVAVNQAFAAVPIVLTDGDEVGFLPPVTGG